MIKELISKLISYENSLESKLDLLTDISIGCTNEEIFRASEEVRNELDSCGEVQKSREELLSSAKIDWVYQDDSGNEQLN
jgi:hypothetical protein